MVKQQDDDNKETKTKDREELLTFYNFPAEHRVSISLPIELAFVVVRSGSKWQKLPMIFTLYQSVQKRRTVA
jgi:hypothetical protein